MKRKILNDVLSHKPSGLLYHYTKQSGFKGIIESSEIWATHTQYLNDQREYLHAIDLARQQIKAMHAFGNPEHHQILGEMELGLEGIEAMNVCVCSFSEERDSLSQWRAYSGHSSGYSIGFDGNYLCDIANKNSWYLAPCIYDEKSQSELISALIQEVLEENLARKEVDLHDDSLPPGGNLNAYLHRYAPILKDSAFREEKEWRLISRPLSCKNPQFGFREGNSMLTPYYRVTLGESASEINIKEVIIGPTPHPIQSVMSTRSFLIRNQLNILVIQSQAPYRNW